MHSRPTFQLRQLSVSFLRVMLCGIGIFYGIAYSSAEYVFALGARSGDVRALTLAVRIYPFDHRFRDGLLLHRIQTNER